MKWWQYLILWIGMTLGVMLYAGFRDHSLEAVIERSYFMGLAVLFVAIAERINTWK